MALGTTGLEAERDIVGEVSLMRYVGGRLDPTESFSKFLDWSAQPPAEYAELLSQARDYAEYNRLPAAHLSVEGLRAAGTDARLVLAGVVTRLCEAPTVLFFADFVFGLLFASAERVGIDVSDLPQALPLWLDLLLMEKAALLNLEPFAGDSLSEFQSRVAGVSGRTDGELSLASLSRFWKLDGGRPDSRFSSRDKAMVTARLLAKHLALRDGAASGVNGDSA